MTILKRKCSQLLPEKITGTSPPARETAVGNYPSLRIVRFDRRQTSRIVNVAKSKGVTVNSVLLRDLFLAIRDWRGELGVNRNDDMLRVCVPVNLRTWRDQDLTVTNSISLLFLDRNDEQMRCEKALLESIQDELHGKNRKDLRISFVTMLHVARHLPGGLKRFLAKRKCWSTCIFSSLGVLFRDVALPREDDQIVAANVRMEQWDLVPPMRDNLGLTICPYTYAGQLSMVLNYDPSRVDGDQLAVMLHTYLARLEASVGVNNGDFAGAASA